MKRLKTRRILRMDLEARTFVSKKTLISYDGAYKATVFLSACAKSLFMQDFFSFALVQSLSDCLIYGSNSS